jgi:DNA-directed RNA polymerase specialized sigma24 family protein
MTRSKLFHPQFSGFLFMTTVPPMRDAENDSENAQQMRGNWPVRPLTRARRDGGAIYVRETEVERQVRELSALPDRIRKERLLASAAWGDSQRAREETLVYFLREYTVRGEDGTAWEIAEALSKRIALHIQRAMRRWRLTPEDEKDCVQDLYAALWEALFRRDETSEFWEVRFWVCLDRRLWNLIEKRQATADAEVRPGDESPAMSDNEMESGLERILSKMSGTDAGPEALALRRDALKSLNENEVRAIYLVYIAGLPEESEDPLRPSAAKALGVTGRSIRNYLKRAKEKLTAWERGDN